MGRFLRILLVVVLALFLLLPALPAARAATFWEAEVTGGFGAGDASMLTIPIAQFGGKLYAGVANDAGAQIWVKETPTSDWTLQMPGGFGDTDNIAVVRMDVYGGYLWAGTANTEDGCGLWRFDGTSWTDALALTGGGGAGFGVTSNIAVTAMEVYEEELYVGILNYAISPFPATQGAKMYRFDGTSWSQAGTLASGTSTENCGIGSLEVYGEYLYACTIRFNYGIVFGSTPLEVDLKGAGCELWRTDGGAGYSWTKMTTLSSPGLDMDNLTALDMSVYNDNLVIGTAYGMVKLFVDTGNMSITDVQFASNGLMVYEYNGTDAPTAIVSGGFGSTNDMAVICMEQAVVDGESVLVVGTANPVEAGKLKKYDGTDWTDLAADGFGNANNLGVSSLAVVDEGGSNSAIYAGTLNSEQGCELWKGSHSYGITVIQGAHGTITPAGVSGVVAVESGSDQAFTVTPDIGYHIVDVVADGSTHLGAVSSYTFTGVTADHTVTAGFAIDTFTLTATAGAGGSISPAGAVPVDYGASRTFTITPDDGYTVAGVTVDGASVGALSSYTFTNVKAGHTIAASFVESSPPASVWYLAEGSTDWGFDCYISVINPNTQEVNVALTYMTSSGAVDGPVVRMPAMSQATVFPKETLGAADFSTRVECREAKDIGVDRTMYWTGPGATCAEAHCATGVSSPATTWYLPEGCSDYGFECFLLIQNPNDTAASTTVTWMIEGEAPQASDFSVAANSRITCNMADQIGARNASIKVESDIPVIPERAMYRNDRREGHDSCGTTTAATSYYLAEGCSGFGFTTYVLVQNPQDTPTNVAVTYQAASGPVTGPAFQMPANSRKTICVNETTVIPGDDPSFSTLVQGSQPIIAERAMYWNGGADEAQVCHDSIGLDQPHASWWLADGQTSEGRETWTLVQNPNDTAVEVVVVYMTPDGAGDISKVETIAANSRRTFDMAEHSGITGRAAIMVKCITSDKNIMVERAMYWNERGTGTDTIGGYGE